MMARPKPRVPIYPRPVSPLHAESYPIDPRDVIYATSCPSSDDDADTRAAKRRRIEKLGEQYLRGDGLHILSAGLKGPFTDGWKNPWAKRERRVKRTVIEIPETTGKQVKQLSANIDRVEAKSTNVEGWLRRNSAYSGLELAEQTSPTSPYANFINLDSGTLGKQNKQPQNKERQEASKAADSVLATNEPADPLVLDERKAPPTPKTSLPIPRPVCQAQVFAYAPPERRVWVSHAMNADRAEFAALKSKRRTLQVAPASTMLSPFEYRRVSDEVQKPEKSEGVAGPTQPQIGPVSAKVEIPSLSAVNEDHSIANVPEIADGHRLDIDLARDQAHAPHPTTRSASVAIPAFSTGTSRASLTNLPSAQLQSLAVPLPSTDDLAIDERILEQPERPSSSNNAKEKDACVNDLRIAEDTKGDNPEITATSKANITPQVKSKAGVDGSKTLLAKDALGVQSNKDTQAMLADMSPFVYSTIKQRTTGVHGRKSRITATKRRPEKSSKRTVSAQGERVPSDSSQGSLKTSLRVSKGATMPAGKENTSTRFGDEETDMPSPDMFSGRPVQSSIPASSPKRLKSVLKPSGSPPLNMPFPSTKGSTSAGIDGGQNVPEVDDDTFDLDGAIDDLGSYLGTPWDVEKEASVV